MPGRCTLALFDLDGVLVDSAAPMDRAVDAALRSVGAEPAPPEARRLLYGPPLLVGFAALLEAIGADPAANERCATRVPRALPALRDRRVALRLHEPAERPVHVADTAEDVRAATANGIPCAAVLWGFGSEQELRAAGATWLVGTAGELAALLGGRSGTLDRSSTLARRNRDPGRG